MPEWQNAAAGGSARMPIGGKGAPALLPVAQHADAAEGLSPAHLASPSRSDFLHARSKQHHGPPLMRPSVLLLSGGLTFSGHQTVDVRQYTSSWHVKTTILDCNFESGFICGTLEARNMPSVETSVTTYWEGEIIDNMNHGFLTNKWNASAAADAQHWSKFAAFSDKKMSAPIDLAHERFIFMRWKEQMFLDAGADDSGLSIAGFYYVCLDRVTGNIEGYYFDTSSTPNQRLELALTRRPGAGVATGAFSFA